MRVKLKTRNDHERAKPKRVDRDRVLSKNTIPPGQKTCNSKLQSRDGYCQQKGVVEFGRCRIHTGKEPKEAFEVFQKSLGLENAIKLETLIKDTLNMNNELASAKVMLTKTLEDWQRAMNVKQEYLANVPIIPVFDGKSKEEIQYLKEMYKSASHLHQMILEMAHDTEQKAYHRAALLTKTLVDGIAKNKKLTEGDKFSMDIKQIREILKVQLQIMAENCTACPKLKNIIHLMRDKMNNIIIDPSLSKENRKAAGARAYEEQLGMVEEISNRIAQGEVIV